MKSFKKSLLVASMLLCFLIPAGPHGWNRAAAQLDLLGLLGRGLGGGEAVRIVGDTSQTSIINTLKTTLMEATTAIMSGNISSLNVKETILDPIAWNLAKQLQQQLTGDLLKWLGGQQPGQNGQVPFVQDFSAHYESIMDQVYGDFINELSSTDNSGLCSEETRHQVQQSVISAYRNQKQETNDQLFSCSEADSGPHVATLEQIFKDTVNCDGDVLCASFKAQRILAERQATAVMNERQALDYSRGMLPQQVCRMVATPNGGSRRACEITNPLYLSGDSISFQFGQLPSLQLLHMDEFNEIVSGFMSNLTNQAVQGLTGVLGLSGNPNFLNNVFGPNGNLSYIDALLQDDITQYQSGGTNPIQQTLAVEQKHLQLQTKVLNEVTTLENKNTANRASHPSCYTLELTPELTQAKADAQIGVQTASTSVAILTLLNQQYSTDPAVATRSYMTYKNQGYFREDHQNRDFETTYVNYTFATMAMQFTCDMSAAATSCGGTADQACILTGE